MKLRIVSDGIRHRVEDENGNHIENITEVTIEPIRGGEVVKATLRILPIAVDVVADTPA